MNHLGVADELQRHELHGLGDVVRADVVVVAGDRHEHEVAHRSDRVERLTDGRRLGEVELDAAGLPADLGGRLLRPSEIGAGDDDLVALVGVVPGDLATDAPVAADDDHAAGICHQSTPSSNRFQ